MESLLQVWDSHGHTATGPGTQRMTAGATGTGEWQLAIGKIALKLCGFRCVYFLVLTVANALGYLRGCTDSQIAHTDTEFHYNCRRSFYYPLNFCSISAYIDVLDYYT